MTRTIKKSLMLGAVVGAMAAMAVPSMASAANWGIPGVNNTLTAPFGLGLLMTDAGTQYSLNCNGGGFGVHVRSPASSTLDINTANSHTCTGGMAWSGCNVTLTPTALPWTADGTSTTNVTLNTVKYNAFFTKATPGSSCSYAGPTGAMYSLEGTLIGGVWDNTSGARKATYTSDTGLRLKRPASFLDRPVTITTVLAATTLQLS